MLYYRESLMIVTSIRVDILTIIFVLGSSKHKKVSLTESPSVCLHAALDTKLLDRFPLNLLQTYQISLNTYTGRGYYEF